MTWVAGTQVRQAKLSRPRSQGGDGAPAAGGSSDFQGLLPALSPWVKPWAAPGALGVGGSWSWTEGSREIFRRLLRGSQERDDGGWDRGSRWVKRRFR